MNKVDSISLLCGKIIQSYTFFFFLSLFGFGFVDHPRIGLNVTPAQNDPPLTHMEE